MDDGRRGKKKEEIREEGRDMTTVKKEPTARLAMD